MKEKSNGFIKLNVAMALCLLTVGILVNPYILPLIFPFAVGSSLESTNRIIAWIIEIIFIPSACLVYFKGKTQQGRKKLAFGFIAVILMVVVIELTLHAVFLIAGIFQGDKKTVHHLLAHSSYQDKDWASQLFDEWQQLPIDYEPFLGWDRRQFKGKYINIDSNGVRKTWNPEFQNRKPETLYVFGGSTVWGAGVRDDYTIPSFISKKINADKPAYEVHNYGERGYTFTQEIIQLTLLLRQGHRPDFVVFYDGVNDVYAAYQAGHAGAVQNTAKTRAKLLARQPSPGGHLIIAIKAMIKEHCLILRAIIKIAELAEQKNEFQEVAARYSKEEMIRLTEETSRYYIQSLNFLKELSRAYDFKLICFWQPVIFLEKNLIEEDSQLDSRMNDQMLRDFFVGTHDFLTNESPEGLVIISDVLSDRTESVYIDFCHLSQRGNEIVATKIVEVFNEKFAKQ